MKTISWYEKAKEELKARNSKPENPEGEKVTPEAEPEVEQPVQQEESEPNNKKLNVKKNKSNGNRLDKN